MIGKSAHDLTEAEIRNLAIGYLSRREYGVEELRRKLLQRGAASGMTEQVVSQLADENLVSDERFTEMYVRTRIRSLYGPVKIKGELRSRGINDHQIAEALPSEQETWFDIASQWAARQCRGELDYAARAKMYRSLMNRGFTHEQANVALDHVQVQFADRSI
jgi:regulatory protein